MSGLTYLCEYGNDSEDSEGEILENRKVLPSPNLNKVKVIDTEEDYFDDTQKHCGKIRSFSHTRGNWASFVFVTYPQNQVFLKFIEKLKLRLCIDGHIEQCDDIHISLSRTFVLKYHMISTFSSSLQAAVQNIESFTLAFDSITVYCNEEKTRTFIALKVDCFSHKFLLSITEKINKVLEEFRLPPFYEDPSFHASVLWMNGDKTVQLTNILQELNSSKQLQFNSEFVTVDKVCSKIGNKLFQYSLD